ncbi:MAG: HAMP domain-containing histidine kinase [Candidatus Dormibacteraeota bacterium]|nr:HAMP domain-containing histidine kinase [Candidatus Dormibacteraeota bacterium]
MSSRLERVRSASLRVALISTAITAVAFAIVSLIVVMYVSAALTSQVDNRLTASLTNLENTGRLGTLPCGQVTDPSGTRFGPRLLIWIQDPVRGLASCDGTPLPVSMQSINGPTTLTIQDTDFRVTGAAIGDDYYVLGQTLTQVTQARSTIIVAELIVGGALLVLVFFGALAVGSRVGAPIELARQRQMEFTADASHELRTPLSVIEAQTSLALAQVRDPDWYRQAFTRVAGESQRIRRLVEDLLWLARVDSPGLEAQPEPIDVGVLATQAVDRFTSVAEARHLQLSLAVTDGSPVISASSEWLDRLLGVLLDNACKYSPEGGRVGVSVSADGNRVRLAVEDSGPGIPPHEQPRIFDRFHRASELPGAGLGLAIADAVVRVTHGRWDIGTSAALGGASMAVTWPRTLGGAREPLPRPAPMAQQQAP